MAYPARLQDRPVCDDCIPNPQGGVWLCPAHGVGDHVREAIRSSVMRLRAYPDADTAWAAVARVRIAIDHLKTARLLLQEAGSRRAHRSATRAIKSAEGAERHSERIYMTRYYDQRRREGTA